MPLLRPGQEIGKTIDVGSRKQIFIDKRFITSENGVKLTVNPPVKMESTIVPEKPWELGWVHGWGTVLEDQGKYKMWYPVLPPLGRVDQTGDSSLLCYAESEDGIRWAKPNLGIYEWQGSKSNNILLKISIETATVFIDPRAIPEERYKLVAVFSSKDKSPSGNPGMYIYTSPDGFNWKLHPVLLFPFSPDSQNQAFYDTRINKYVIYLRQWDVRHTGQYDTCCRTVGRIETDDIMKPWPYKNGVTPKLSFGKDRLPPPTGEVPTAFGPDERDPKWLDHYTSAAVQYPWAENAYFIFPSAYLHYPNPPLGKFKNDGPVDIQLAVSRDGVLYDRPERKPYIELGLAGSQDSGSIYMLVGMLRHGNEIYQYYGGFPFTHGAYRGLPEESGIGAIIRVRQRLDGFVSADAGPEGGSFTTPSIRFRGKRLELNMNASAMGEVHVELRDEKDTPISGYSFEESDALHMNNVAQVVTWRSNADLSQIKQPVKIAFRLRSVKLYAFQFVN